ncbi:hypothetical protein P8452_48043 [Trifolium repens]|nr:hypothetical protein P8452_48043 [Trifolium repens]
MTKKENNNGGRREKEDPPAITEEEYNEGRDSHHHIVFLVYKLLRKLCCNLLIFQTICLKTKMGIKKKDTVTLQLNIVPQSADQVELVNNVSLHLPKSVLKNRKLEFDGLLEEEENLYSETAEDSSHHNNSETCVENNIGRMMKLP